MDRMKATLKELAESTPTRSLAARQYKLVEKALGGLESIDDDTDIKTTAQAALNLLRAATDQESTILR